MAPDPAPRPVTGRSTQVRRAGRTREGPRPPPPSSCKRLSHGSMRASSRSAPVGPDRRPQDPPRRSSLSRRPARAGGAPSPNHLPLFQPLRLAAWVGTPLPVGPLALVLPLSLLPACPAHHRLHDWQPSRNLRHAVSPSRRRASTLPWCWVARQGLVHRTTKPTTVGLGLPPGDRAQPCPIGPNRAMGNALGVLESCPHGPPWDCSCRWNGMKNGLYAVAPVM